MSKTCLHNLQGSFQELIRIFFAYLDHRTRLENPHFLHHIQDKIGEFIHGVRSIRLDSSGVDQGKIRIRTALLSRHSHFRRGRLIVKFHPEGLEEFSGFFFRQSFIFPFFLEKRIQMLVQPSGIKGIPCVEFDDHTEMNKPIILEGFPKIARSIGRHSQTHLRNHFQLLFPFGIFFLFGQLFRFFCMAAGIMDKSIGTDIHGNQFFPFFISFRIIQEIQLGQTLLDVFFKIYKSFPVNFVIQNRMPGGPLLHKFCEDSSLIGIDPLLGHLAKDSIPYGLSPPERYDFIFVQFFGLLIHSKRCLFPRVQYPQILQTVGRHFGISRCRLGAWSPLPNDEFSFVYAYGLIFEDMFKSQRSLHRGRNPLCHIAFIKFRDKPSSLRGNGGFCL